MRMGFSYQKTDTIFISYFKNGTWDEGQLVKDDHIDLSIMSTVFHYGQSVFEGLKAYKRKDGNIQLFRVEDNALRMKASCERMVMPVYPVERFVADVMKVVKANISYVPNYKEGTLYIRPVMFGIGDNLGLKPANEYMLAIITSPVGPYFDHNKPIHLLITDYDRVAQKGTGKAKTGGNYAASMYPQKLAKQQGYNDVLFLDPIKHENIEEVGAANFIGITKDNEVYTPISESILDGITKRSILYIAKHMLGLKTHETVIPYQHINMFTEAAACGTAAVMASIGSITKDTETYQFMYQDQMGPTIKKIYDMLTGIQFGDLDDPDHWITIIHQHEQR